MLERLRSRKFWVWLLTAASLALQDMWPEAVQVTLAYLGAQGFTDAVAAYRGSQSGKPD